MKQKNNMTNKSAKVVPYRSLVERRERKMAADMDRGGSESAGNGLLFVVMGVLILLFVSVWILPAFHVGDVVVSGAQQVDASMIQASSGIRKGDHLLADWGGSFSARLGLRYLEAEENIKKASAYIRKVRVRMHFPGKVKITIEERIPTSYIALDDSAYILLDREGFVLEIVEGEKPDGIPMIEGVVIEAAQIGQKIQTEAIGTIDTALNLIDALIRADRAAADNFSLLSCIREIRVPQDESTYLKIKLLDSLIPIHAKLGGAENFDDALNWLRYTVHSKKLDHLGSGVLDLSGDDYVFIRDVEEDR